MYVPQTDGYNVTSSLIGWAHTQNHPCIHTSLLCFVYCGYILSFFRVHVINLPISIRAASLELDTLYDCPYANNVKDNGEIIYHLTMTKCNKA